MASYMRKAASLSSSFFKLYGTERSEKPVRSCFLFWLSPRNMSSSTTAAAELPSLSPSSLSSPLLLFPPEKVTTDHNSEYRVVNLPLFSLADNQVVKLPNRTLPEEIYAAVHCAGSSHGWLAFVNGRKCGFYLANILSPSVSPEIIHLPPIETLRHVKRVFRDPSANVVNKYHVYNLRENQLYAETPDRLNWYLINRFAMSSAPNNGNNNCTVMVSHGMEHDLSFCRIGDTSWTPLNNRLKSLFMEIIYSKKDQLFYALTHSGYIEAWDLNDPTSPKGTLHGLELQDHDLSESEEWYLKLSCGSEEYLVESAGGDILYVIRYYAFVGEDGTYVDTSDDDYPPDVNLPYRTTRFEVYRLEFEKEIAEPVTSIGDSVLFLGFNQSFSLSASDCPHLKPNSIYFADLLRDYMFDKTYPYGGHDVGVYNLEDHSVTPLYHPFEFKKILPAPIWIFPWQ